MSWYSTEMPRSTASAGRPKKNKLDSARERIIEAARTLLRNGAGVALQRRECAATANVTPALISYYFREQHDLIEAAARPLADDYNLRLKSILSSDKDVTLKLRSMIKLFLFCSFRDGKLFEQYNSYIFTSRRGSQVVMIGASVEVGDFLDLCVQRGYFRNISPLFIRSFIWGACKAVAQDRELRAVSFEQCHSDEEVADRQADLILEIVCSGCLRRPAANAEEMTC